MGEYSSAQQVAYRRLNQVLLAACLMFRLMDLLRIKKPHRSGVEGSGKSTGLSNGACYAVEGGGEIGADKLHGGDDDDRNACRDQTILDCGRAGLVQQETHYELALRS